MGERTSVCIVAPAFNEAESLGPFHERLAAVMDGLADRYDWRLLSSSTRAPTGRSSWRRDLAAAGSRMCPRWS